MQELYQKIAKIEEKIEVQLKYFLRKIKLRHNIKRYIDKPYKLSLEQKQQIRHFWGGYKRNISFLWHEFYYQKTGVFDVRYIPEDLQFTEIEGYFNNIKAAHGIDDKNYYALFFPEANQPKTICRKMNGVYYDENYNIISLENAKNKCVENKKIILKVSKETGKGGGIYVWETKDGLEKIEKILKAVNYDYIVQDFIKQNKLFEDINPSSVQIVRVMTFMDKMQKINILKSFFQFGRTDAKISQESWGGAQVSIDEEGKLYKYDWDLNYNKLEKHPNGLVYLGWVVPCYKEICELAIKLHRKMGNFRLISWDFTVSVNNEPVFIEMNIKYGGINAHQLGSGPLYGDRTIDILEEVFVKQ